MKNNVLQKGIILSLLSIMCISVNAQDAITKFFDNYARDPNYTSIIISSKMFNLFADLDIDDPANKETLDAISGLTGIKILVNDEVADGVKLMSSALKQIGSDYEVLMSITEKDEKIRFYIKEKPNKHIEELLMLVGGETNFFIMSITGDIDLKQISKLSKGMNVGGMDYLKNLEKEENKTN